MNKSETNPSVDVTTVSAVHGPDSKAYTYLVTKPLASNLRINDLAVVNNSQGWSIVKVMNVHKAPRIEAGIKYAWISCRIPVEYHTKLVQDFERAGGTKALLNQQPQENYEDLLG
jgi:hypothetical protein